MRSTLPAGALAQIALVGMAAFASFCDAQATTTTALANRTNSTAKLPAPELTWQGIVTIIALLFVLLALSFRIMSVPAVMFLIGFFFRCCGIISTADFFGGLANSSVVTLALLFVVVGPLTYLPLMKRSMAWLLAGRADGVEMGADGKPKIELSVDWIRFKLCFVTMGVSWFIANIPLIAMMCPMIKQFCRDVGHSPSQYLMSLNVATLLGGSLALIGASGNLIYDALLRQSGNPGMPFFEIGTISIFPCLICIGYAVFMPRWLLSSDEGGMFRLMQDKAHTFLAQFIVLPGSALADPNDEPVTVAEFEDYLPTQMREDVRLVQIVREDGATVLAPPKPSDVFMVGDVLVFAGEVRNLNVAARVLGLQWLPTTNLASMRPHVHTSRDLVEAIKTARTGMAATPGGSAAPPPPPGTSNEPTAVANRSKGASPIVKPVKSPRPSVGRNPSVTEFMLAAAAAQKEQSGGGEPRTLEGAAEEFVRAYTQGNDAPVGAGDSAVAASPPPAQGDAFAAAAAVVSADVDGADDDDDPDASGNTPIMLPAAVSLSDASFGVQPASNNTRAPVDFVEAVLAPASPVIGQPVSTGVFENQYRVSVLALRSAASGADLTGSALSEHRFAAGDTVLCVGPTTCFDGRYARDFLVVNKNNTFDESGGIEKQVEKLYVQVPDWFCCGTYVDPEAILPRVAEPIGEEMQPAKHVPTPERQPPSSRSSSGLRRRNKKDASASNAADTTAADTAAAPSKKKLQKVIAIPSWYPNLTILIFLIMMGVAASNEIDIVLCVAAAVVAMVLLKLVTVPEALKLVDLDVYVTIAFALSLGAAMIKSGLADVIGRSIVDANITGFPLLLLIGFITILISNLVPNQAAAQVIFPVVVSVYKNLGIPILGPVCYVTVVTSACWTLVQGSATNLIIMGPGGYSAADFLKFGILLSIVFMISCAVATAVIYDLW